jgi:hypothetical protein
MGLYPRPFDQYEDENRPPWWVWVILILLIAGGAQLVQTCQQQAKPSQEKAVSHFSQVRVANF